MELRPEPTQDNQNHEINYVTGSVGYTHPLFPSGIWSNSATVVPPWVDARYKSSYHTIPYSHNYVAKLGRPGDAFDANLAFLQCERGVRVGGGSRNSKIARECRFWCTDCRVADEWDPNQPF